MNNKKHVACMNVKINFACLVDIAKTQPFLVEAFIYPVGRNQHPAWRETILSDCHVDITKLVTDKKRWF